MSWGRWANGKQPATTPLPGQQTGQQANPTFGQRIGGMFQKPAILDFPTAMLTAGLGGKYGGYAGLPPSNSKGEMQQQEMQRRQVESQEEYRRQQIEVDRAASGKRQSSLRAAAADREATRVAAERLNAKGIMTELCRDGWTGSRWICLRKRHEIWRIT